jgi:N-acylneuraminate cytidylyltransferase
MDYVYQGAVHGGKLDAIKDICAKEGIGLHEVAYIGDDINCLEALSNVGYAACPADALPLVKQVPNIIQMQAKGGEGAVREFYERFLRQ